MALGLGTGCSWSAFAVGLAVPVTYSRFAVRGVDLLRSKYSFVLQLSQQTPEQSGLPLSRLCLEVIKIAVKISN